MKQYKPHKYQEAFHKSNARFRTLVAGRRSGKTLGGAIEAIWHATQRKTKGWIVAPTYSIAMDVDKQEILRWLPNSAITSMKEKFIQLNNGSEIYFKSGDDPDNLRGSGLDWLWLDEASFQKPYVWEVVYPSLSKGDFTREPGIAWITTTPKGYDWVHSEMYKPAIDGDDDYAAWQYRTIDNPHIDPETVKKAQKTMSEQMFRQEYLATFEKFSGLVYPDFTKDNILEPKQLHEDDLYFIGIDVGYANPTAVVLLSEDIDHNLYIVDEWYESHKTAQEIAAQIIKMTEGKRIDRYIIDPSAKGTQQTSGMNMFDQLQELGIPVEAGNNDVMGGISRMTYLLRNNMFNVFSHCENTIGEFEKYSWQEKKDGSNMDERPKKVHDHLLDAIRYVAMSRPEFAPRQERDMYNRPVNPQSIFEAPENISEFSPVQGEVSITVDRGIDEF